MPLVQSLSELLSESEVTDKSEILSIQNTATFRTHHKSEVLVKTKSIDDIIKLLDFCATNKLSIYVVSGGKNWGFGSAVPPQDVAILLDLSPMNRIISYDSEFGTIRCEAGVTFKQLSDFLKENGNKHFLNTIGGDPNSSVVGNILERGDGAGPYCERSEYVCSPEVLLPDGSLINLGMGNSLNSTLVDLCKTSIGPNFQEIFFQSNYGIITKISIWLCPIPKEFRHFQFYIKPNNSLSDVLNVLKRLFQQRILSSPVTFWNDYKQFANTNQYPWHKKPQLPLDRHTLMSISNNYTQWYGFGGIYIDDSSIAKHTTQILFSKLKPFIIPKGFLSVLSRKKIRFIRLLNTFLKNTKLNFDEILGVWEENPLLGNTSKNSIKSLFWRKQRAFPASIDPQTERCGLHWNSFVVPFDGETIVEVISKIDEIVFKHGYEPIISIVILNDRYVKVFQQLIYDRELHKEDIKALVCHQEIFDFLNISGYSHTRLGIQNMNSDSSIYQNDILHKKIKQTLDPNEILQPNRYLI